MQVNILNLYFTVVFNRRSNERVGRRHPDLWFFLRKLRLEQKRTDAAIIAADRGVGRPPSETSQMEAPGEKDSAFEK